MTGTAWLILWTVILAGSLLFWIVLLRRTIRMARNLQREVRSLIEAIGSVKAARQTRLHTPDLASHEKGR
jgi:hypothetical protein